MSDWRNTPKPPGWKDPQERGSAEPVSGRCGAKIKHTDPPRYCMLPPLKGRQRCRAHGGKTPRGAASPHAKHLRRSRYATPRIFERVEAFLADPEAMSLREDFAVLEARLGEILAALDAGNSTDAWEEVKSTLAVLVSVIADYIDDEEQLVALERHRDAVTRGSASHRSEREGWNEIRETMAVRAKLQEAERRREELLEQNMTAAQVAMFVARVAAIVKEKVADPTVRQAIADALMQVDRADTDRGRDGLLA